VPRVTLIVLSLLATAACLAAIVLAGTMGWLMVAMVAMGLTTGISGPAIAAYAVEITAPELQGPAMGAMRFAGDLGYLVGPVSFGLAIDLTGIGQSGGMALNAGLVAVLAVLFLGAHRRARRPP
jgi:MFS family permease